MIVFMYESTFRSVVLLVWALLAEVVFLAQSIRIIKFCAYISWKTGVGTQQDWKVKALSAG